MAELDLDDVDKWLEEKPKFLAFIEAYRRLANFRKACEAINVHPSTVRAAMRKNPSFMELFQEAEELVANDLEDALRHRAIEGVDTLKFDKNGTAVIDPRTGEVYVEKKHSDLAAFFLLKGVRPAKYRERFEHTGKDGGPIEARIATLAELVNLAKKAEAKDETADPEKQAAPEEKP